MDGYLEKKGEKGLIRVWRKRYFCTQERRLYYSTSSSTSHSPVGFIDLNGIVLVKEEERDGNWHEFNVHMLSGRTYQLRTKSEEDKDNWIAFLLEQLLMDRTDDDGNPLVVEEDFDETETQSLDVPSSSSRQHSMQYSGSTGVGLEIDDATYHERERPRTHSEAQMQQMQRTLSSEELEAIENGELLEDVTLIDQTNTEARLIELEMEELNAAFLDVHELMLSQNLTQKGGELEAHLETAGRKFMNGADELRRAHNKAPGRFKLD
eukprot:TRINITY_DN3087_c0_g1_i1.p1 TRINITY_DN3087_c0_g1~~TRINITY_DN3087_c0_g1_i1.p1  ORF type:complete len:265 (-),score=58.37 TRINITY_DN3087_c0_g1_i1:106-900(-)